MSVLSTVPSPSFAHSGIKSWSPALLRVSRASRWSRCGGRCGALGWGSGLNRRSRAWSWSCPPWM